MSPRKPDDAESRGDAGPLYAALSKFPALKKAVDDADQMLKGLHFTPPPGFHGETFEPQLDTARLNAQLRRVRDLVIDGQWRTLREIAAATGDPEASVSARLRDLRKLKFGGWTVKSRRRGEEKRGIHEYRCSP